MIEVKIQKDQKTYTIEADVEVDGKDRTITGGLTFMNRNGAGSFSIKVKSGMLSFDEDTQEDVFRAVDQVVREAYQKLLELKEAHTRAKNGEDEGQLNAFEGQAAPVESGNVSVTAE